MKFRKTTATKFLALICALTFVLPISSCDFGRKKVAILLSDKSQTFFSLIASSVTAIVNTKRDAFVIYDAQNNVEQQIKQLQEAIIQGCTDIICIPVDVNYTEAITQLATSNKIPLVYVNRYPFKDVAVDQIPKNVFFVGMENHDAGEFQAKEYIGEMPPGKEKRVVILRGDFAENPTKEWLRGIKDVFDQNEMVKVVIEQNGQMDRTYSKIFVDALISASKRDESLKFNTILAYNDAMALGALDAVIANDLKDQIYISGINGGGESRKAVRKGLLPVSFFQDPSRQGNKAAQIIYALKEGKKVDVINWIPLAKVKRLNRGNKDFESAQQSRAREFDDWATIEMEKEKKDKKSGEPAPAQSGNKSSDESVENSESSEDTGSSAE